MTNATPGGGESPPPSLPTEGGSTRPEGGEIWRPRRSSAVGERDGGEPPPKTAAEPADDDEGDWPPAVGAKGESDSSILGQLEGG